MTTARDETTLARWQRRLAEDGFGRILTGRLSGYARRLMMDNRTVGRWVERRGDRVRLDGLVISVRNRLISTEQKSTVFFGLYEMGERELIRRHLDQRLATIELGGSIGVVACGTNRLLADPTAHVVVEANPVLVPTLIENRDLNGCRFAVEPAAVAYSGASIGFTVDGHFLMGRVGEGGGDVVAVPTVTVGGLLAKYGYPAVNLVCDIEGAEVEVVANEPDVLRGRVRTLVMETHPHLVGAERTTDMLDALEGLGFRS